MRKAAKRKTLWLVLIASALAPIAPAFASSHRVLPAENRVEVFSLGVPNRVEQPHLSPVTASSYYDAFGEVASESSVAPKKTASVDELVDMMNKRAGTKAEFATGDAKRYLEAVGAEGSHLLDELGKSHILLRRDVATRRTASHEWLHRHLQRKNGGPIPGEDKLIEDFLDCHKDLFKLGD